MAVKPDTNEGNWYLLAIWAKPLLIKAYSGAA
jgi:hypothetical protein